MTEKRQIQPPPRRPRASALLTILATVVIAPALMAPSARGPAPTTRLDGLSPAPGSLQTAPDRFSFVTSDAGRTSLRSIQQPAPRQLPTLRSAPPSVVTVDSDAIAREETGRATARSPAEPVSGPARAAKVDQEEPEPMPTGGMIQRAIAAGEPSAATLDTPADVVAPKQPDSRVEAAAPVRMPPAARSGARREPRATVQRATPRATRTSSSRIEGDNTQPERNVMVGNRIGPTWARFDEPR